MIHYDGHRWHRSGLALGCWDFKSHLCEIWKFSHNWPKKQHKKGLDTSNVSSPLYPCPSPFLLGDFVIANPDRCLASVRQRPQSRFQKLSYPEHLNTVIQSWNSCQFASLRPITLEEAWELFIDISSILCLLLEIQGMWTYNFYDWDSNTAPIPTQYPKYKLNLAGPRFILNEEALKTLPDIQTTLQKIFTRLIATSFLLVLVPGPATLILKTAQCHWTYLN